MILTLGQQYKYCTLTCCTEVGGQTRSIIRAFFAFHELLKRFMKVQLQLLLEQCMLVPRTLFGGAESTSKSMLYSSDSQQLLLFRSSVNGAYFRNTQEKQLLGYQLFILFPVRGSCCLFFLIGINQSSVVLFPVFC